MQVPPHRLPIYRNAAYFTGPNTSMYAVVNLNESRVDETKWFQVNVRVKRKRISIAINGEQLVDYTEPDNPVREETRKGRVLKPDGGGIALQAHDPKSVVFFKDIRIRELR